MRRQPRRFQCAHVHQQNLMPALPDQRCHVTMLIALRVESSQYCNRCHRGWPSFYPATLPRSLANLSPYASPPTIPIGSDGDIGGSHIEGDNIRGAEKRNFLWGGDVLVALCAPAPLRPCAPAHGTAATLCMDTGPIRPCAPAHGEPRCRTRQAVGPRRAGCPTRTRRSRRAWLAVLLAPRTRTWACNCICNGASARCRCSRRRASCQRGSRGSCIGCIGRASSRCHWCSRVAHGQRTRRSGGEPDEPARRPEWR